MATIGKELNIFKLTLSVKYNKGDILSESWNQQRVLKIIEKPKHKYHQWWFKILYYLTFTYRFEERYEYTVESIPKTCNLNRGLFE